MRLFAAIDPPAVARERLSVAVGRPREDAVRYVPVDQWHVTTAFYGDVPDAVVPELVERLSRAAQRSAVMSLAISGVGTFPKQAAKARVLWAGLDGDVAELIRLAERCVAAGRRCGLTMEERAYRPHLTLARARRGPVDLRREVVALSSYAGDSWPATTLRLVRSTLGAHPSHETLEEWPLSG